MYVLSISYKNTPLDMRGAMAFSMQEQLTFENKLVKQDGIEGCVVISTCNRTEIYVSGKEQALDSIENALKQEKGSIVDDLKKYIRRYQEERAMRHLYRVVAGMDSMVVGEDEILGQVRDSYQLALEAGMTDYELNTIFQGAFTCAKKIKTETKLSKTSVSIGTLATSKVFHWRARSDRKTVLLIGMTGKMGSIVYKNLLSKDGITIIATVREHSRKHISVEDEKRVKIVPFRDRYQYIDEADIIISVTASPHYTITRREAESAIRTQKERLFMDLAVPRDIDSTISEMNGTTLLDIDYYKQLAMQNNETKLKEAAVAEDMIEESMEETMKEMCFHRFMPYFARYQRFMRERTPEQALYQIRDAADYNELRSFLQVLKRIME